MQTIYQMAEDGRFTGATREIEDDAGAPGGWTRTAPPENVGQGEAPYWVGTGWVVAEIPPPSPPAVPHTITPGQGLMALYLAKGITEDQVLAAINGIEDDALRYQVQIAYAKATTWERDSISVRTMTGLIGLTDEEVDDLFREAVNIAL